MIETFPTWSQVIECAMAKPGVLHGEYHAGNLPGGLDRVGHSQGCSRRARLRFEDPINSSA